jgi:MFS family permease
VTAVTLAADAPIASGGVWAPQRRRLTAGLVLTVTLVAFESLAISTVMPVVADDLGGVGLYGWVFSGFFLGTMVGAVLAGRAADARGTAVPYIAGLGLFAVGLTVGGAAPTMTVLVAARVVQGLGAGAIPAIAYTSVGQNYPPALRPRVFAVFSTAWVVPGFVGPVAATAIEHALSWRAVFLAILPLVAVAAVMTLPALGRVGADPALLAGVERDTRPRDALILAVGAGLVVGGLAAGSTPVLVVLVAVGFPVTAWAFLRLVPPGTARAAPGLPAAVAVRGVLTFAFFGTDAFVPLAVTDGRGDPSWVAGLALTAGVVGWTAAAWIQQHRIHHDGPRRLVVIGCALVAVGAGGALVLLHGAPLLVAIPLWTVCGFGTGLSYAPLSVTVLGTAAPGSEGRASSSLQLTDVLGVALGTGASGAFVALGEARDWSITTSLTGAFILTAAVALAGSVLARRLPAQLDGVHT